MDATPTPKTIAMPAAVPLHRLAARLRQQHAGKTALLVDLSAIPNIHSRIMFRSMARFIEERTLGEPIDALPLARNILVLLASPTVVQRLKARLEALSGQLQEQRQGSIGLRAFDLDSQADQFVETTRRMMEQAPAPESERLVPLRDDAPPDLAALYNIIDVHRILWQADLANQCRRQTIWQLEPNTAPAALTDEIWVSISALEQATGMPLRDNIWLFGKTTELLDQRIIAQLHTEGRSLTRPLSVNLHLVSAISTTFLRLLTDKPATDVRHMMVEIPLVEWRTEPHLADTALKILRRHEIQLCLDGIRPEDVASLTDAEWQAAAYLKFDAARQTLQQQIAALQALPPERQALLQQKAVFCHCDDSEAVSAGLELGIRYFQGRGLTPLLEDTDAVQQLLGVEAAEGAALALKSAAP